MAKEDASLFYTVISNSIDNAIKTEKTRILIMEDFKKITFGEISAENEKNIHPDLTIDGYYDGNKWVDKALNEKEFLFLGVKGTGKSSLLTYINSIPTYNRFSIIENLDSFPFSNFTSSTFSGSLGSERSLPRTWVWILIFQFIWLFESDNSAIHSDSFIRLITWLKEIGFIAPTKLDDVVLQTRNKRRIIHGPALDIGTIFGIADASVSSFKYETDTNQGKDIAFENLIEISKKILMECRSNNKHYLMIDGLDRCLFFGNDSLKSIASLIDESLKLNNEFKQNNNPFKIIIVCRKDLFDRLPLYNANTIKQSYACEMKWFVDGRDYFNNNLVRMVNHRASLSLGRSIDIFQELFERNVEITTKNRKYLTITYIMWHTRNTPRDFLAALKCIQAAHDPANEKVTSEEIIEGLKEYAHNYFFDEIKDELRGYYDPSCIDSIFAALSSFTENRFHTSSLIKALQQEGFEHNFADKIIRHLFDCSALGQIIRNKDGKEKAVSVHYISFARYHSDYDIIVHRALWKPLGYV